MREWFLEQLAMYSAYHRDRRNQATHHVGVPLIVFGLLVGLSQVHIASVGGFPVTGATVLLGGVLALYLANVPLIGVIAVVIYGILYVVAERVGAMDTNIVWITFIVAFGGGWVIQLVGHMFEGRKPAFLTNITQVFMAPPFLIAEILFAVGMEQALLAQVESRAVKYFRTV